MMTLLSRRLLVVAVIAFAVFRASGGRPGDKNGGESRAGQ